MNQSAVAANRRPSFKAVVFDMDGLMLNTEDVFELAGQELLQRRGKELCTMVAEYKDVTCAAAPAARCAAGFCLLSPSDRVSPL